MGMFTNNMFENVALIEGGNSRKYGSNAAKIVLPHQRECHGSFGEILEMPGTQLEWWDSSYQTLYFYLIKNLNSFFELTYEFLKSLFQSETSVLISRRKYSLRRRMTYLYFITSLNLDYDHLYTVVHLFIVEILSAWNKNVIIFGFCRGLLVKHIED